MEVGLDEYRRIEIHRPQYPLVLKWVDPEFKVIYINMDAAEDANIICLVTDDEEEGESENNGKGE